MTDTESWLSRPRSRSLTIAVMIALLGLPASAGAADWHLNSSITEEFTYDNNFRLDPNNEETLWGFNTRPKVGIESHTPRTDLFVNGRLNFGYFPDKTEENSLDPYGDASVRHRTERSEFGVSGNVSYATTRTTEDDDSGRDFSDARRLGLGGNASWSYALSERAGAGLQGGANYVTYDTASLEDYSTFSGGPFLTYRLSEKDSLRLNAIYTRYDRLSGLDASSDIFVGNANWTHTFHPQWVMSVRAGASYVSQDEDVQVGATTLSTSEDKVGFDGGATLSYTEERATISGSLSHGYEPSGVGEVLLRNRLSLNASYRATPVITVDLGTSFILQSAIEGDAEDRNFISVEPGVSWQFLPNWSARAAYLFRTQEREAEDRAFSHGGLLSVTWNLPRWGPGQGK